MKQPPIRDTATVTVSEPVDGTVKRRCNANGDKPAVVSSYSITVDHRIMSVVRQIKRSDQQLVVVSETEVLLTNKPLYRFR